MNRAETAAVVWVWSLSLSLPSFSPPRLLPSLSLHPAMCSPSKHLWAPAWVPSVIHGGLVGHPSGAFYLYRKE